MKRSTEDLVIAFESILESVIEESGLGTSTSNVRPLSRNQIQMVEKIQKFVAAKNKRKTSENCSPISETISSCDGFIAEWESSGVKSAAVQQLIALLNRPHIRGLLWSTEDVSTGRFSPELPEIPFEVDEDEGVAVKIVRIVRRDEPLGATIKCDHGNVFVARIMAGGVADRSGCIQEGDRVLEVNGETVLDKKPDEIVKMLNKCDGGTVTFKLVPVEVWHNHSSKAHNNNEKTNNIYFRALFDYDGSKDDRHPCPEAALSFRQGDILELLVCSDEYWWQARRIGNGALAHLKTTTTTATAESKNGASRGVNGNGTVGLIPSELLQQKSKGVEEEPMTAAAATATTRKGDKKMILELHRENVHYESVCKWNNRSSLTRPIILIGPPGVGRNELKRRLLMLFPERFGSTVPHTSRAPRPGETDGVDYYFTSRKTMEKMIENDEMLEFGEFRGNYYGTAISSVRMVREKSTPLLTPHILALRHLRTAEFCPIIIFIKPPPFHDFKETREALRARMTRAQSAASSSATATSQTVNSSLGRFTDADIKKIIDEAEKMEKNYGYMFDVKLINANLEDSMSELIKLIQCLETKPTWVPLNWATKGVDSNQVVKQ